MCWDFPTAATSLPTTTTTSTAATSSWISTTPPAKVPAPGLTSAQDADDRIVYKTTTGALFYDADGVGGAAAVQFAVLDNHAALTKADFVVVCEGRRARLWSAPARAATPSPWLRGRGADVLDHARGARLQSHAFCPKWDKRTNTHKCINAIAGKSNWGSAPAL
jgi:hypothetical protein